MAAVLLVPVSVAGASSLPAGFDERMLATVDSPTAMAFTPDGRLLITSKNGPVYLYDDGVLHATPAIDLGERLCTNQEAGLSGVTVGPDFADSHHVYLYYTWDRGTDTCGTSDQGNLEITPVNRLSRFVLGDDDVIDPASEQVLIDNIPSPYGIHHAGDLHFGKDGYLYVSVGDGGCDYMAPGCGPTNRAARYPHALVGKILRITSDGGVPLDNPYTGPGTTRCNETGRTTPGTWCQEIFARGLRNPFRMAFDPYAAGTRFLINDVGQATWEEVDEGLAGADYGWPIREGKCATDSTTDCGPPPAGITNPIYAYDHSGGCASITAGAFVPPGVWPTEYDGTYLFGDFVCNKLFRLEQHEGGEATEIASEIGAIVAMTFGTGADEGTLYYLSWAWGAPSGLHSLAYTGAANRRPKAVAHATPTNGSLPLDVEFDATDSSDADDDTLTYEWDFGDDSPRETGVTATHRYETAGTYTATLEVSDDGTSDMDHIRIDPGNHPPEPVIEGPAPGARFGVGEAFTLSGSATDPEDGPLADAALTWEVVKHHATHVHPFLPPTQGAAAAITAPLPEDFHSTTNSYLEIRLTATDSRGLSRTVTQDLRPDLVDLGFATSPAGLRLEVNGNTAPPSLTSWRNWRLELNAPDPQWDSAGQGQTFRSWSDGGAQRHTIDTPAAATDYLAAFTSRYARPKAAGKVRVSLVPAYQECKTPNRSHGPPLAHPSCGPPGQTSAYATVGTPDANGSPARSTGYAELGVRLGNPATPANEADVAVKVTMTDVLDPVRGTDYYVGALEARVGVQMTDGQNGTGPAGTDSATMAETPLSARMPCLPDMEIGGSTCRVATSMNALVPGAVLERQRAIWELGTIRVYDGGDDGDPATPGNTLLAGQGLFVP